MTQMTTRSWQALPDTQRWWAEQPERIAARLRLRHDIATLTATYRIEPKRKTRAA